MLKKMILTGALVLGAGCGGDAERSGESEPSVLDQISDYDSKEDSQKPKGTLAQICDSLVNCSLSYYAGDNRCGLNSNSVRTVGAWIARNCDNYWLDD